MTHFSIYINRLLGSNFLKVCMIYLSTRLPYMCLNIMPPTSIHKNNNSCFLYKNTMTFNNVRKTHACTLLIFRFYPDIKRKIRTTIRKRDADVSITGSNYKTIYYIEYMSIVAEQAHRIKKND